MNIRWLGGIILASILLVSGMRDADAVYNANMAGVLTLVATYADGDYIYFTLQNQPTSHPGCNPGFFVLTEAIPQNRRNALLARLLTAYAAGETVNVGYDSTGDCAHGYIRAHRVG